MGHYLASQSPMVVCPKYYMLYQSEVLYALWAILAWLPNDCLFLKVFPQNSHSTCCSIPLCLATMCRLASDFCINPFPQIVQLARPSTPLEMNSSATKPCKSMLSILLTVLKHNYKISFAVYTVCLPHVRLHGLFCSVSFSTMRAICLTCRSV